MIEVWDHWAPGAHRLFGRMVSASGQAQGGSFLVGFERNAEGGLATGSCRSGR